MNRLFLVAVLGATTLGLTAARPASASFVNGGFETGNFTGWTTLGNTSVGGPTLAYGTSITPPEGAFQARLDTGGNFGATTIETALGLTPGSLGAIASDTTFSGSAIYQSVTVAAGDTLSFLYNFGTNEAIPSIINNDFSFVSITPTVGATLLLDTRTIVPQTSTSQSGYLTYSYQFTAGGTYKVGVGVLNVGDNDNDFLSSLFVDDFRITPGQVTPNAVPAPAGLVLGLLGVPALGLLRRRTAAA
jgi:hypothetical protein